MVLKCMVHQDNDVDSICLSCRLLICQHCKADHEGHEFGDDQSLNVKNNAIVGERLQSLWSMVIKTIGLISHHENQEETIHLFFEQLYNFIMVEERKLIKPVEREREKNQKKLDILLKNIDGLLSILSTRPIIDIQQPTSEYEDGEPIEFQPDYNQNSYLEQYNDNNNNNQNNTLNNDIYNNSNNNNNNNNNFEETRVFNHTLSALPFDQLKELVAQYDSIEKFIDKHTIQSKAMKSSSSSIDFGSAFNSSNHSNCNDNISIIDKDKDSNNNNNSDNDNDSHKSCMDSLVLSSNIEELYKQIVKIEDTDMDTINSELKSYDDFETGDVLCGFGFDAELLEKVKNDLKRVYEIDFSTMEQRDGGKQRQWARPMARRMLVRGGMGVSACYDGVRYIYLTGGFEDSKCLDRIDRFDTTSGQFVANVGKLTEPLYNAFTFYHNELLYVVGGWKKEPHCTNNCTLSIYKLQAPSNDQQPIPVLSFQVSAHPTVNSNNNNSNSRGSKRDNSRGKDNKNNNNHTEEVYSSLVLEMPLKSTSGVEKCCFDPLSNHLYYMGEDEVFFRLSINSQSVEILPPLPIESTSIGASLLFGIDNMSNRYIYLVGGEQQKLFHFDLKTSTWSQLQPPPYPTSFQSAIGLLEQ
ncbi:hypothetical protein PPL_08190 [Heterostelium album PN500]|uniref:B box-type domain-containing protein n=1 Tax=Heterostelium pallidum (strain ATCC 26659 / Pp 5 / PN500) TaxID=670386 RepID=D3BIV5_HETP5|nr:hypothetical protein PPL_08190 [Heterostelium album PN500]EFA78729.1 hypothetical protein PPL_08190 [Heterostelium album PN500]|eukprot:XP_020430853.1 hypothetical protein PPL_08190 [Heterostelium album PN500]